MVTAVFAFGLTLFSFKPGANQLNKRLTCIDNSAADIGRFDAMVEESRGGGADQAAGVVDWDERVSATLWDTPFQNNTLEPG